MNVTDSGNDPAKTVGPYSYPNPAGEIKYTSVVLPQKTLTKGRRNHWERGAKKVKTLAKGGSKGQHYSETLFGNKKNAHETPETGLLRKGIDRCRQQGESVGVIWC